MSETTLLIKETKDLNILVPLVEDVQNLHNELYPKMFKPFNKQEIHYALETHLSLSNARSFVVFKNDIAVGYVIIFLKEIPENAFHYPYQSILIDQISVLKKYRNIGAGKLLMDHVEKIATELSITRIELEHWNANHVGAAFFRKNGYNLHKEKLFKYL